jgi:hypothetical protein
MRRLRRNIAVTSFLLLPAIFAVAQRRPGALVDNVNQFARSSGYIFSGTVLKIQRTTAGQNAVAFTQITFRVDEAIQGVRSRKIFTIREWSGLWDSGERYRPGERVLLFLYPVSKLGFTSPVGGPLGRFAVDHAGKIHINGPQRQSLSSNRPHSQFAGRSRVSPREFAHEILHASENEHEQVR